MINDKMKVVNVVTNVIIVNIVHIVTIVNAVTNANPPNTHT
jgi:hypothetical protein